MSNPLQSTQQLALTMMFSVTTQRIDEWNIQDCKIAQYKWKGFKVNCRCFGRLKQRHEALAIIQIALTGHSKKPGNYFSQLCIMRWTEGMFYHGKQVQLLAWNLLHCQAVSLSVLLVTIHHLISQLLNHLLSAALHLFSSLFRITEVFILYFKNIISLKTRALFICPAHCWHHNSQI